MKEKVLSALTLCQKKDAMENEGDLNARSETCDICPYKLFGCKCKQAVRRDAAKVISISEEQSEKSREQIEEYWNIITAVWRADDGRGMKDEDVVRIFDYANKEDMLLYKHPLEVIEAWGDRHNKFTVDMIVKHKLTGKRAIVVSVNNDQFSGLTTKGAFISASMKEWENTGLTANISDIVVKALTP